MKNVFLWICCFALSAFAAEVSSADSTVASGPNIALTRSSVYLGKGVSIGVAGGVFNPTEDCDCLGVWQAQLEYFYSPRVSGGLDVRFFGGDLDSDVMILYQRYRMNVRFHFPFNRLDFFASPVIGLETTDIEEFRDEWDNREDRWWKPGAKLDSVDREKSCEKMFSLDGFSIGAELGAGWRFSRLWGLTGGALYEYNFSRTHLLTLSPGVAFNLRDVWGWASRTLLSSWITLELNFLRYFNRGVPDWGSAGFIGLQIGI